MKKRVIVRRGSLNKRHNIILVSRRILGIILGLGATYCAFMTAINAVSNKLGDFNQDGYPTDDPVGLLIVIGICLLIAGLVAYPFSQKLKRGNRYKKHSRSTTLKSIVL